MRLLQVSARSLLLYSIMLVLVSIPVAFFSIQAILSSEVDESIALQSEQFVQHIKNFEYLDDLERDLTVLDKLSGNLQIKYAGDSLIEKHYQTGFIYDSLEYEMRPFRQLFSPVKIKGENYILTVRMSLVENDDLVMAIAAVQIALSILLSAGLLLLNRSLSKRLWRPFYRTLDQLKAYELDKSESVSVEKSNINEFDDLNQTVNNLTERNRRVFLQQKEFIENASHELQTPIAIFKSKLDSLMQSPTLSQVDSETIHELESTAKRMGRLNKNLLLLNKIDNEQFIDTEDVDVSSVVSNQLAGIQPVAQHERIAISATMENLWIKANRALIEILVSNLLHNAIRHGTNSHGIGIAINGRTLTFTNHGAPLKMKINQLTQRFTKESNDSNSTGLGLAIVKKICDSCAYSLQYTYADNTHSFAITFNDNVI
jgi:signal transduction histidine kinase